MIDLVATRYEHNKPDDECLKKGLRDKPWHNCRFSFSKSLVKHALHKFTSATLNHMLDSFSLALKRVKLTPFAMAADCFRGKKVTFHRSVFLER